MISAVVIISKAEWYPLEGVIASVAPVAEEVVVNVDAAEPKTLAVIQDIATRYPLKLVISPWNWEARDKGQELARQTNLAVENASGDWILDVQADEVLHENEHEQLLEYVRRAPDDISGFRLVRLYFFREPELLRWDWTHSLVRLFRKGSHKIDGDAMNSQTLWGRVADAHGVYLYHYSRVARSEEIIERIMSLSRLFHAPQTLTRPQTYDFRTMEYDSFSSDNPPRAVDEEDVLVEFTGTHPKYIESWLKRLE